MFLHRRRLMLHNLLQRINGKDHSESTAKRTFLGALPVQWTQRIVHTKWCTIKSQKTWLRYRWRRSTIRTFLPATSDGKLQQLPCKAPTSRETILRKTVMPRSTGRRSCYRRSRCVVVVRHIQGYPTWRTTYVLCSPNYTVVQKTELLHFKWIKQIWTDINNFLFNLHLHSGKRNTCLLNRQYIKCSFCDV